MKNLKNSLQRLDTPETLLVVSLYPHKGETYSAGTTGVASYTKNVVEHVERPVVVLADYHKKPQSYKEGTAFVWRCFKPGTLTMWVELLQALRRFKHARHILLQFDFSMYGGMIVTANIISFLALLKILGFRVSVVSHHVVTDVKKIAGHIGLKSTFKDSLKAIAYNTFFHAFYAALGLSSKQVIVLEDTLKAKISRVIRSRKVVAIPHAVDSDLQTTSRARARKKLGIKPRENVVMFFGFINWFKGADFFTHTFKDIEELAGKKTRFILAGGESATLKDKQYYQEYLAKVTADQMGAKNLTITGYVPQSAIKDYFAAADLVIFPYRHFMCASGVLSLVFSYQKPFVVSTALKTMFEAEDFKAAMKKSGLRAQDLTFSLNKQSTIARTEKVLANGLKSKMVKMGGIMRQKRSFQNTAQAYEHAIFKTEVAKKSEYTYSYAYNS